MDRSCLLSSPCTRRVTLLKHCIATSSHLPATSQHAEAQSGEPAIHRLCRLNSFISSFRHLSTCTCPRLHRATFIVATDKVVTRQLVMFTPTRHGVPAYDTLEQISVSIRLIYRETPHPASDDIGRRGVQPWRDRPPDRCRCPMRALAFKDNTTQTLTPHEPISLLPRMRKAFFLPIHYPVHELDSCLSSCISTESQ